MKFPSYCNKIIQYSFYSLFFFVPLIFLGNTSELFEFNKMWFVFGLTIIIGAAWISKMIIERKIIIRKTLLDIPLALFLISQIISTIFSLDTHVSLWGYYTRFNGGLLSLISYIFLYYAFVSNLDVKAVSRMIMISLASGIVTAVWGFPSHFGYDPTCFVFRGSLDTNCWTDAFKPTIRVFSTLGQPAWFAAYLNVLLPLSMAFVLLNAKQKKTKSLITYFIIMLLFYVCLIFTNTRAGTAAFFAVDVLFWIILFYKRIFIIKILVKYLLIFHIAFAVCNFFFGAPISNLDKFTLPQLQKKIVAYAQTEKSNSINKPVIKATGITDSAQIRMIVWRGAIDAWAANPIFGTGVETFAFAYYRYRPTEHNLTSEWDYLYNKAHNEYLNYLTTTGIFGLGSYLLIIGFFIFLTGKLLLHGSVATLPKKNNVAVSSESRALKQSDNDNESQQYKKTLLVVGLFCGWISILITNFFGFSVVIINLYFFLIPAFIFLITGLLKYDKDYVKKLVSINAYQWVLIIIVFIIAGNMILGLFRYWYADTLYALGYNLDRSNSFQQAFPLLKDAVSIIPSEPLYKDELAVNLATLAEAFYLQNDATTAGQLAMEAISLDNQVIENHPNNIVFWKNRLRIFYSLANGDSQNKATYLSESIKSLNKSRELAPTDAKISYNLGVLLGQTGNPQEAVTVLEKTIELKPDYSDAYFALGLIYHQLAIGQTTATASSSGQETIVNPELQKKAINVFQYVLDNLNPNDEQIKKTLEEWKK